VPQHPRYHQKTGQTLEIESNREPTQQEIKKIFSEQQQIPEQTQTQEPKDLKLKEVKRTFWRGIHKFKQRLLPEDNEFICMTILCLIKLRQIDPDSDTEGLLVCGRKKPSKRLVSH